MAEVVDTQIRILTPDYQNWQARLLYDFQALSQQHTFVISNTY